MNLIALDDKIRTLRDEANNLKSDVYALLSSDFTKYPNNYNHHANEAHIRAEKMALKLREILPCTTNVSRIDFMSEIAHELKILICDKEDLTITFPALIPRRKYNLKNIICEPLDAALSIYSTKRMLDNNPIVKFGECIICVTHYFDRNLTANGRVRDIDGIEMESIINTITPYLLTDDSGTYCSFFHTGKSADSDSTKITILEKHRFNNWLSMNMILENVDDLV